MIFDATNGSIRRITLGDREVVRQIYGAVRRNDWGTVQPRLDDLNIEEFPSGFTIQFTASCRDGAIDYRWTGVIRGSGGALRYEFHGQSFSNFQSNRIGLCVLHPIRECAGSDCEIVHSDGTIERSHFPKLVSPNQPFLDVSGIRHGATENVVVEVSFEGEIFETEDQRNWTDASFKTYAPPLSRPFPHLISRGDEIRQTVTVRLLENGTAPALCNPSPRIPLVKANWQNLRRRVPVGFCASPELGSIALSRLCELKPDHLRADLYVASPEWIQHLQAAQTQASKTGAGLHVAIHLSSGGEREQLNAIRDARAGLRNPINLWLIFHQSEDSTAAKWVELASQIFGKGMFAAGTYKNFAELNRARPPAQATWFPSYPMNPQVHAIDSTTIMENLAAQVETVRTVRSFSQQPVVVSPITLLPAPHNVDARENTLFGATWAVGSLANLGREEGVHSLTYFKASSFNSTAGTAPMFHVFAGFAEMDTLCEMNVATAPDALAAFGGIARGKKVVWIANLTPEAIVTHLDLGDRGRPWRVNRIEDSGRQTNVPVESSVENAEENFRNGDDVLELGPYGIARLEMDHK